MRSFLLDVVPINDTNRAVTVSYIQLILREDDNKIFFKNVDFSPFFYFENEEFPEIIRNTPQIKKIEKAFKKIDNVEKELWKVVCYSQDDLKKLAELLFPFGKCYEYDIPFVKRFLSEMDVKVFTYLIYDELENDFVRVRLCEESHYKLNSLAFDIETYNPRGTSNPREDSILMISYCDDTESKVLTYRNSTSENSILLNDEKEMIEEFKKTLRRKSIDVIYGYNSSQFDFPYLRDRAKKHGVSMDIGRDNSDMFITNRGRIPSVLIAGRIHADVYQMVFFLARIGALKTNTYTLGEIYSEVFGIDKKMVNKIEIYKLWDSDEMRHLLVDYCMDDSVATYKLGERFLPIFIELAKIVNLSLKDTLTSTTGQMVESYIIDEAIKRNFVIPSRPTGTQVFARDSTPIEGAYVKIPEPGVYDNIVVFDFRSLYPSIIVAHNISPDTINCDCCKGEGDSFISPEGHRFCKKRKGLIPEILRKILMYRKHLKSQLKEIDKESDEYVYTYARQYAFKILANSFYGMLGYVRARWYCKECAAATTAWERFFIKDVIQHLENKNYNVLYSDTDSIFVLMEERKKEEILKEVEEINRMLPDEMELELEDFYKRGLFVSKRSEKVGAKKKYALLSENGSIKIRGFELVRRDWSGIARKTQREILEIILTEGDIDKAVNVVQRTIDNLKKGRVHKKDLIINTVLRKNIEEYKGTSPEISAARKAQARGMRIKEGQMIKYIITSKGDSISSKAELAEFVRNKDYDVNYYIDNQVLPAVEKILGELGYDSSLLKTGKKQSGLDNWF